LECKVLSRILNIISHFSDQLKYVDRKSWRTMY